MFFVCVNTRRDLRDGRNFLAGFSNSLPSKKQDHREKELKLRIRYLSDVRKRERERERATKKSITASS